MMVSNDRLARMAAEYEEEEAHAAKVEASMQLDQTVISVRVPTAFAHTLKDLATHEHLPTSTYVRQLLINAVERCDKPVLTEHRVEEIAARVVRQLHTRLA
jgi:hypothetical protein